MNSVKKILVPLAFTDHSLQVFNCAVGVARAYDADIFVVSIINSRDIQSVETVVAMGYEVDGEHYLEEVIKSRKTEMDAIAAESGFPRERIHIEFKVGQPADLILSTIHDEKPDLVVMGTRGRSNLGATLVGDVAKKVFRKSQVPILSFRGRKFKKTLFKRFDLK